MGFQSCINPSVSNRDELSPVRCALFSTLLARDILAKIILMSDGDNQDKKPASFSLAAINRRALVRKGLAAFSVRVNRLRPMREAFGRSSHLMFRAQKLSLPSLISVSVMSVFRF